MTLPAALSNLRIPVIGSPLFIASCPELVIEQCKGGIVGSFPALNARPAEMLDQWIRQIKKALEDHKKANPNAIIGPIAVNQIVHQSNDRLAHDVEVCACHSTFSGLAPRNTKVPGISRTIEPKSSAPAIGVGHSIHADSPQIS